MYHVTVPHYHEVVYFSLQLAKLSSFSTDLFEHLPVVAFLAHHHRLQLLWLEEVHHVHVTYLEESPLEIFKHSLHWFVEDVVDKGSHELFPIKKERKLIDKKVMLTF